jgi:DNA-binding transcriptional LysR family regulator|tara:strand:- start:978 stop:1883 length:906 start_codon:yes stop_codon:yes gene_type:complete
MDTIDGMRTLVAVVKAGSFTAAAARLNISTALVSKYVGKLEERLGSRLLHRTTRSLALTEVGAVYYKRCQQVLADFDQLEAAVQHRNAAPSGKLIVSAPTTFGELYLTDAVADFLEQQPAMTLDLRLTDRFVGLVGEGIDVAIRIAELADSTLIARRLAPARVVACAAPAYLARHGTPREPADLTHHSCVVDTNFQNGPLWSFKEGGKPRMVKVGGRFSVNSAQAVRRMLLAGFGIGMIPTYAVGEDLQQGRLAVILEPFEALNMGVYAIYAHNRHLAATVRAFVDFAVKRFGSAPPWDRF